METQERGDKHIKKKKKKERQNEENEETVAQSVQENEKRGKKRDAQVIRTMTGLERGLWNRLRQIHLWSKY